MAATDNMDGTELMGYDTENTGAPSWFQQYDAGLNHRMKSLIDERIATHLQPLHDKIHGAVDIAKEARDQVEFLEEKLSRI